MSPSGFVTIAKVVKAHGLQGEVCIESYADSPFLLQGLTRLYVAEENRHPWKVSLSSVRPHGNSFLIRLEEIRGREQARRLVGLDLLVRRRDLPGLEPEEILMADLAGMTAVLPDRRVVGRIVSARVIGGQEIWTLEGERGEEILFPAVEPFVLEVRPEQQEAVIDPPPGLLEVYGFEG
jgi:16S rRNA processing protein RimM